MKVGARRRAPARLLPVLFCCVGVACAVLAVVARSRAQTPRRVYTLNVATAPARIVVADDCPVDETCVATGVRAASVTTVLSAFPGRLTNDVAHAALAGSQLAPREAVSRRTLPPATMHRETVDVRTSAGVLVTVVSLCVDQGSGVRASQSPVAPAAGPATVFAVVPGQPGCSVGVILRVPAGAPVPWAAATTLAHRSELQLPG